MAREEERKKEKTGKENGDREREREKKKISTTNVFKKKILISEFTTIYFLFLERRNKTSGILHTHSPGLNFHLTQLFP